MSLIRPFKGLRPTPEYAPQVVAPPYDVLSSAEARERAAQRPWSFLHISKPEIDLPEGTDPHAPAVYAKGAENFAAMLAAEVLRREDAPCYYFYRLDMGEHVQTGLVAVASVAAYESNRIRRHEFTRPDKEDDRVRQIDSLNAQTGPVFLTYRHDRRVDSIAQEVTAATADLDVTADDQVRHRLWVVRDATRLRALSEIFDGMERLYIADGHHRSAAAARVAAARRAQTQTAGDASHDYFLAVIFPDDQIDILDYNRVVADLGGLSEADFLARVKQAFDVSVSDVPARPQHAGEFGMYLAGRWYRLAIHADRVPAHGAVDQLDVSLLDQNLIAPILGITDPRRDRRIDFVGGIRGLAELERRVDSGEMVLAFALYPTQIDDLMAVADAGDVMPPKSTWFEPKLADGLVSHVLD